MTDRRILAANQPPKPNRWPRTERRQNRIEEVIDRRQPDLMVILENVHDPHNVSAVLRSCDAVGVLKIALVYTVESAPAAFAKTTSGSAAKWVEIQSFNSVDECYSTLKSEGFTIFATALGESSRDLFGVDFTKPAAIAFGNEMRGLSQEAIESADATIEIPMVGMVRSLNISVACAVTLYEAFRQRREAGFFTAARIVGDTRSTLVADWLRR